MTTPLVTEQIIQAVYLVATVLLILSLKWMNAPSSARRAVRAGELGMLLAIGGTLLYHGIIDYKWIAVALVAGSMIGVPLGLVQQLHPTLRRHLRLGWLLHQSLQTGKFLLHPSYAPF